jgi:3-hydroxyacyl-CoA dehydrogenase, NAD binding domain/3-hydroxyacyl-CoA dehydrogenase, C-terminal domain
MQSNCKHPARVLVGHPFNPPHIIPLVEVVGGAKTSPDAIRQAIAFYASIGKKPIHLRKELPGHVANRLQAALYREVMYLIQQGVLSVAEADDAVSYGPGLRWGVMGPSLQWHLGGGAGGIKHFMEHLMDPLAGMMKVLGTPDITPELKHTIIDGVLREAGDHSVEQLAAEENQLLVGLLGLREQRVSVPRVVIVGRTAHPIVEGSHSVVTVAGFTASFCWRSWTCRAQMSWNTFRAAEEGRPRARLAREPLAESCAAGPPAARRS